jgi:hypothetical protein
MSEGDEVSASGVIAHAMQEVTARANISFAPRSANLLTEEIPSMRNGRRTHIVSAMAVLGRMVARGTMNYGSILTADRRQTDRLAIHHHSRLTVSLDGPEPGDEAIHGVTLIDISHEGMMATDAGHLVPGALVLLEVPLVGWREAEVRWIADNRAGCRFTDPLDLEELRLAAAASERLAGECPALAEAIAKMPPLRRPRPISTRQPDPMGDQTGAGAAGLVLMIGLTVLSFLSATWLLDHFG